MEFEGPEKKLEIVLKQPRVDLRGNIDGRWDRVVESAYTKILNHIENPWIDAYLLSESSLFVYPDRIILITCGGSRPFQAIPTILKFIDPSEIKYIFYERKNFLYPESQISDFRVETQDMNRLFPGQRWLIGEEKKDHIYFFFAASPEEKGQMETSSDTTLEILMHDISEDVAQLFYASPGVSSTSVRYRSGIQFLFETPEILYDDYLFQPCGYSVNALVDRSYFTIHVTPQSVCSYVSFETNIVMSDYSPLVDRVLECFSPKRFTLAFTGNKPFISPDIIQKQNFCETFSKEVAIGHGYDLYVRNYHYEECLAKMHAY